MIKKILNKVFYAVIIALVFAFINRGCAKALGNPFYPTGTLDFNIITKDSSDSYIASQQTRNYDFSLLLEEHSSEFENYNYFFVTLFNCYGCSFNNSNSNHYIVELYFTDSINISSGSSTITGNLQRYVYDTNYVAQSNAIFDASNTLTATSQLASGSRSGIPIVSYYKRIPFYTVGIDTNYNSFPNNRSYVDTNNFLDSTNIPLINNSYSSPNYYVPLGSPGSWSRSLLFTNYTGNVFAYNSTGSMVQQNYEYYIGEPTEQPDYDIQFSIIDSSNNSQELYNNDNTITGAGIAAKYLPLDNDLFDYYYYWEEDTGDSPIGPPNSFSDWNKVSSSENGIAAISVDSNGWLYASIAEKNSSSSSYSKTLHYTRVGSISLIPVSNNKISTWLDKFAQNINYGGPISSILTIPINLVSALYNGFGGTCHSFNMGAILGTNITFNCFTLQSILGSDITNIIDMICSFVIYYHLILFIISIYRKVMNLDELDDYMPQHLYHPKHGSYEDYNE